MHGSFPSPVCPRTQSNQTRADECRCSCRPISPHTRFPVRTFTTMQSSIETAGLLPLPNAAHRYSSNRGLCYHVATPPIDPYDSLRYIQALENEVGSAALKYGGSEQHRHAPTLKPKQQQQQKWNGGRPYVPGGAGPPLRQPEPEQRIASLLCGASKTPADTLQPVDCTWWQRRLEIERPTSSADADRWLRQRYAQRPPTAPSALVTPAYRAAPPRASSQRPATVAHGGRRAHHAHGDTKVEEL